MERPTLMSQDRFRRRQLIAATTGAALAGMLRVARSDPAPVQVGYLRWTDPRPTIPLLDQLTAGRWDRRARSSPSATTTRQGGSRTSSSSLSNASACADDHPVSLLAGLAERGIVLILSDLPADRLVTLADASRARGVVLFNIQAPDDALRQQACRADVIHVGAVAQHVGRRARAVPGLE